MERLGGFRMTQQRQDSHLETFRFLCE